MPQALETSGCPHTTNLFTSIRGNGDPLTKEVVSKVRAEHSACLSPRRTGLCLLKRSPKWRRSCPLHESSHDNNSYNYGISDARPLGMPSTPGIPCGKYCIPRHNSGLPEVYFLRLRFGSRHDVMMSPFLSFQCCKVFGFNRFF